MISRYELMTLKPEHYLAQGYRDAAGLPRGELTALWALASAEQLRLQGVTAETFDPLVAEAVGAGTTNLRTPEAGLRFIQSCRKHVSTEADQAPFREHLAAVLRLLALSEGASAARGTR